MPENTWILPNGQAPETIDWHFEAKHPQELLFERLSSGLSGFSLDDVIGASVNVFINAVRQRYLDRDKAIEVFDQLVGKARDRLEEELSEGD